MNIERLFVFVVLFGVCNGVTLTLIRLLPIFSFQPDFLVPFVTMAAFVVGVWIGFIRALMGIFK